MEACWKIFRFKLHGRQPNVIPLPVHTFEHHRINFDPLENAQETQNRLQNSTETKLTQYFENNAIEQKNPLSEAELLLDENGKVHPSGPQLKYFEYPQFYTWTGQKWKRKQKINIEPTIGRMYTVHPTEGERYYLRLLLNLSQGATNFEDLKNYKQTQHLTYRDACIARGLLEDDKEWDRCLDDAAFIKTGPQLRALFCSIIVFCEVANVLQLWEKHKNNLTEDFLWKFKKQTKNQFLQFTEKLYSLALVDIEQRLKLHKKSLTEMGLPEPQITNVSTDLMEQTNYDEKECNEIVEKNLESMNPQQEEFYKAVISSIYQNKPAVYFLDAPGGTGKTFVATTILAKVRSTKHVAIATAFSGIAALLLQGGRTVHSWFKLTPKIDCTTITPISQRMKDLAGQVLREAKVIIWDEAPMCHKDLLECVDRSLRFITDVDQPFGGKTMVLCGDFRQILPVIINGSRSQVVNSSIKKSFLWNYVQVKHLTINERVKQNGNSPKLQKFAEILKSIGNGSYPINQELGQDMIRLPKNWVSTSTTVEEFVEEIFPKLQKNHQNIDQLATKAILTPKNKDVDVINSIILNKFPGQSISLPSVDKNCPTNVTNTLYPVEYLWKIKEPGMPDHDLKLKKGVIIMLLRNIDQLSGACNGTRLQILSITKYLINAKILTGPKKGNQIFIPRIYFPSDEKSPVRFVRKQFPVRVAFAMTINKAQGQTLKKVGLYLPEPVFTHGQFYVAVGRVGSPEDLSIFVVDGKDQGSFDGHEGVYTRNVVYKEILDQDKQQNDCKMDLDFDSDKNEKTIPVDDSSKFQPKCNCGEILIHVQNDKRKNDLFEEYWCDECDVKLKTRQMIYHCKNYFQHQKDYCVKCARHLYMRSQKAEMDDSD